MRGRRGVRDWFTEEHHAQRELAAAGWRVRYAPWPRATRVIEDRGPQLVRGRLAYGARRAVQGGPGAAPSPARHAATAFLGAGVALARRDTALAGERSLRAVENAGAALGSWLAHDDFQPVGPTPFRASVPPAQPGPAARAGARAARRLRRPGPAGAILLYHRVADLERDGLGLAVRPQHFAEHVEVLRERWRPTALPELAGALRTGELADRSVAITLDDGYVDNLLHAAPALEGVPATAFVATALVGAHGGFFWDEAQRLVEAASSASRLELTLHGERRAWRVATPEQRRVAVRHVHQWLQAQRPEDVARALDELRAQGGEVVEPSADERAVTLAELRELGARVEIGAHTRHHPRLAALGAAEQRAEIEGSRDDVARWLGRAPAGFSYPFGVPEFDFTAETVELVRAAGFDHAVANAAAPVTAASDPLVLPRLIAPDVGGGAFAAWLEAQVVG
jgi:peptidoglycan/xylan/chitin deacetylase (PgdA/CDA1 family)